MLIHFSKQSANAKTGKIPVSTSCETTCPTSCPLKNKGCYAKTGPVSWHWNKVSNGLRGDDYNTFIRNVADIKHGSLWRHNVGHVVSHDVLTGIFPVLTLADCFEKCINIIISLDCLLSNLHSIAQLFYKVLNACVLLDRYTYIQLFYTYSHIFYV